MIALDTETTGLDFHHGARPYLVTICDREGQVRFYEWPVDPLTREVDVPASDVAELNAVLRAEDRIVGQNLKFDAHALKSVGVGPWPWDRTDDTLIAAHLLASAT